MKQRIVIITAIIFAAFIFIIPASGQNGNGPRKMKGEFGLKKLNLTDTQQAQIDKLRIEHQKEMVDLQANLKKQEIGMEEVTSNKNFSSTDFINVVQNISKAKDQIALAKANHFLDVYKLLDNTQKAQWLKMGKRMLMMKGMKENRGGMMHHDMMMKGRKNMPPKVDDDN
jgi:Spy/CpxP family protein refolding chaperone